jgi:hypothetical protein
MWALLLTAAAAWPLLGPEGAPLETEVAASDRFAEAAPDWAGLTVQTDPQALAAVAASTLEYLRSQREADPLAVQPGLLSELGVSLAEVEATLEAVVRIAAEDAGAGASRLTDPAFLAAHFRLLAWTPDAEAAAGRGLTLDDRIRLTRYLVYQLPGATERSEAFPNALYAPPQDEDGLSLEAADARRGILCRYRYTRPQVISGALEADPGCEARPLIWLSEQGVYEAMMQGTVEVLLPDGSRRTFNVARSNGVPYDPAIHQHAAQGRYWYFAEVDGVLGWGDTPERKVRLAYGASVAGDVYNLGLGKLVALEGGDGLRLAVLSDTGGAFQPNLFQLDFLAGAWPDRESFTRDTAGVPERARAGVLLGRGPDGG